MNEYLTIGQLASIFDMNVQLLRHYDSIGLLVPKIRNAENGRRLYHFDQIYLLATIRFLRKLGFSLEKINEYIHSKDTDHRMDTLINRAIQIRRECDDLMNTVRIIDKNLAFINKQKGDFYKEGFCLKTYPDRNYVHIGEELNLFTHELLYFFPTIGFYTETTKRFGAYLFCDDEEEWISDTVSGNEISVIPGGTYLCGYHFGPYQTIYESIDRIKEAARGHTVDPYVITLNVIDQAVESSNQAYVTALELRLLD